MSKFYVVEKIELDFMGPDWAGCFISFKPFSFKEVKEISAMNEKEGVNISNETMEILKRNFIDGLVWDGKEKVKLTIKDLEDMPVSLFNKITFDLVSSAQKKIQK